MGKNHGCFTTSQQHRDSKVQQNKTKKSRFISMGENYRKDLESVKQDNYALQFVKE